MGKKFDNIFFIDEAGPVGVSIKSYLLKKIFLYYFYYFIIFFTRLISINAFLNEGSALNAFSH